MIAYETGGKYFLLNLVQMQGSVFPKALVVSLPSAVITIVFVYLVYDVQKLGEYFQKDDIVMNNNAIWSGFSFLVGFLVVFRTQQAYSRFWEGVSQMHKMGAEWFDACSSLIAFCKHSEQPQYTILRFQNMMIRLFSMLHAAALGEIEDAGGNMDDSDVQAFRMELIDAEAIDAESIQAVRDSDSRVELIFQWIQQYTVENIKTGVLIIPPPILSRSFQEIATGMVHFHEAMKISNVPFPFPYAQTCDALLILHWLLVPFIVSQWCRNWWWAGIFSFMQVFTLWTLNLIAVELENPFGPDPNDIDGARMQVDMNNHLRLLVCPECLRTPVLRDNFVVNERTTPQENLELQFRLTERAVSISDGVRRNDSFQALWNRVSSPNPIARRCSTLKLMGLRKQQTGSHAAVTIGRLSQRYGNNFDLGGGSSTANLNSFKERKPLLTHIHENVNESEGMITLSPKNTLENGELETHTKASYSSSEKATNSSKAQISVGEVESIHAVAPPPQELPYPPKEPYNGAPHIKMGKWEPVGQAPHDAVQVQQLRSASREEGLQVRLGEIFNQLDTSAFAESGALTDSSWEESPAEHHGPISLDTILEAPLARPPSPALQHHDRNIVALDCGVCISPRPPDKQFEELRIP